MRTKITLYVLTSVLMLLLVAVYAGDKITLERKIYTKSKQETVKVVEELLDDNFKRIYITKTYWNSDIAKGYKYQIDAEKEIGN